MLSVGCVGQRYDNPIDGSSNDSSMRDNGIESSASSHFCCYFLERRWYYDTSWWLVKSIACLFGYLREC